MHQIGALALDLLRDELSGLNFPPRRVELACRIVDRASVGPASPLP
jgi:DNA-binding LacI/PurR family transcriptional regulator